MSKNKAGKPKNKRYLRNYLIDRRMQIRIVSKFLFLIILSGILSGTMVFMTTWPLVSQYVPFVLKESLFDRIVFRLIGYGVPLLGIMSVFGIVITHRIAGPLYKLEQRLAQRLQGKRVEAITIRKGDEFQELVEKINALLILVNATHPPENSSPTPEIRSDQA